MNKDTASQSVDGSVNSRAIKHQNQFCFLAGFFQEMEHVLIPQNQQLFTWLHPALDRQFVWSVAQEQNKPLDLNRDDAGLCYLDSTSIFWVSFLDGVQRVLLFTDRQQVAIQCSRSLENEISNIEVIM